MKQVKQTKQRGAVNARGAARPGATRATAPRPALLPARMRGEAAQPRVAPARVAGAAGAAGARAPRPELLPPAMRGGAVQPRRAVQRMEVEEAEVESRYPATFEEIATAAAFAEHTLEWLTGALEDAGEQGADELAKTVRHAYKRAVPAAYRDKKMPSLKAHGSERLAEGYVYGQPNDEKRWKAQAKAPTIRALIQPKIASQSALVATLKAMFAFVHEGSRAAAKYKYLAGHAAMEIDPILIYVRIPDGPGDTYADFSGLDAGVYEHVVGTDPVPFYIPFGSFHLSVNPRSSKATSLSAALYEAVKLVASKKSGVTAKAVAEAWLLLNLGKL